MTHKHLKAGWYINLKGKKVCYCRSGWEKNYAAYLDWLVSLGEIKEWAYEEDEFEFHNILRGTRFYKPDFKIWGLDGNVEYHEVKGYWTAKAKTQVKRFRKYYPEEKLVIIDAEAYKAIAEKSALIPRWE